VQLGCRAWSSRHRTSSVRPKEHAYGYARENRRAAWWPSSMTAHEYVGTRSPKQRQDAPGAAASRLHQYAARKPPRASAQPITLHVRRLRPQHRRCDQTQARRTHLRAGARLTFFGLADRDRGSHEEAAWANRSIRWYQLLKLNFETCDRASNRAMQILSELGLTGVRAVRAVRAMDVVSAPHGVGRRTASRAC